MLASECGRHREAAELWDRACRWDRAAVSALCAGRPAQAVLFAARARRPDLERSAIDAALRASSGEAAASLCERAGFTASAGRVLDAVGRPAEAAPLFERGGAW